MVDKKQFIKILLKIKNTTNFEKGEKHPFCSSINKHIFVK